MRRVVVTGIGAVTPLGRDVKETWDGLIAGRSGIKNIPESFFLTGDLNTRIAGLVPGDVQAHEADMAKYFPTKDMKKMDRFIQFAISAASQAIDDSGIHGSVHLDRVGVMAGSGIGGLAQIEDSVTTLIEKGPRRVSPFFIPGTLINLASGHISIKYGFTGPNQAVVTACASGAHAIGDAARIIGFGDADVMVAGGCESAVCRIGIAGFNAARALSTSFNDTPEKASRPWDDARDGFVMGEGAGFLVLEELEHAKKRGAIIYAELVGYGSSGDAHHITSPSPEGHGAWLAMNMATRNIDPSRIEYINAHGTSTPSGDMVEIAAMKKLLQDDIKKVSISSTKSAIGHLLGAAGGVEAIFSILAMRDSIIPPTLNLENPSEGCEGIDLTPLKAKEKKVDIAMSNSFGFGGTNSSLVFKKYV